MFLSVQNALVRSNCSKLINFTSKSLLAYSTVWVHLWTQNHKEILTFPIYICNLHTHILYLLSTCTPVHTTVMVCHKSGDGALCCTMYRCIIGLFLTPLVGGCSYSTGLLEWVHTWPCYAYISGTQCLFPLIFDLVLGSTVILKPDSILNENWVRWHKI